MPKNFIPVREAELVTWSANFSLKITGAPVGYGLTAQQAEAYAMAQGEFVSAYQAANDPGTRSPSNIVTKNAAKKMLIGMTRGLARIVQATPTVTDAQKSELGLTVRNPEPTPIPVPEEMPEISIVERIGTMVRIRLHDGSETHRGKPEGVQGASVFSYVGATPPTDVNGWKFEGNITKTVTAVMFDQSLPAGTMVWFTAFWYNPRGQSGLGCTPVSTVLAGGGMMKQAA